MHRSILSELLFTASWDTAVSTDITNPELTQLTLVDLHPARTYDLRMFVSNCVGTSEASNVLTVTTDEAGIDSPIAMEMKPFSDGWPH